MQRSIYDFGLEKTAANHAPLTPLSFLARAAEVPGAIGRAARTSMRAAEEPNAVPEVPGT